MGAYNDKFEHSLCSTLGCTWKTEAFLCIFVFNFVHECLSPLYDANQLSIPKNGFLR